VDLFALTTISQYAATVIDHAIMNGVDAKLPPSNFVHEHSG